MHIATLLLASLLAVEVVPTSGPTLAPFSISGWRVECGSSGSALACVVLDEIRARANGTVLSAISLTMPAGSKSPQVVVQIPLGIAIDDGVRVGFENGAVETLRVYTCNREGCFARGQIGQPILSSMHAGKQPLRITYANLDPAAGKQAVQISVGLEGFNAAYDRLR